MKITDVVVDAAATLGRKLWLVDVTPAYEYHDGTRTSNILGYKYTVVLPEQKMDKIAVRIDGPAQMEAPNGYTEVTFENLELSIYWTRGDYAISARATKIKAVKSA